MTSPEDFQPRPGGLVATARKQRAAQETAAAQQAEHDAAPRPRKTRPVTVKIRQPNLFGAKTMVIAAGASAMAMPADPNRKRGMLNLITSSATVLIARDRSSADSGTGFILQSGQPCMPIEHTREVWLNNPGGSAIQVSVFTESYDKD